MKNVTISVEEDLWVALKEAAGTDRVSMNAFIRETLRRTLKPPSETVGERVAALAEKIGPGPRSWKWNRVEIYEDAI